MSIEALGHVFLLKLSANEKWLAVCLANHADKWGDSIFPALDTLEDESGMSRSTIKRAFKGLLALGVIERSARSTPVSPAFYRIVGVPEPKDPPRAERSCPTVLRRALLLEFGATCEYCKQVGTRDLGPDGRAWEVDRVVPGIRGGVYAPDNVTLACRFCNHKKKGHPAPTGTRTLLDRQRERTVQVDPSLKTEVGGQPDPSSGFAVDPLRGQAGSSGGVSLTPEPVFDPISDPSKIKAGASPRPPDANLAVITKLAHETYDLIGLNADAVELAESVKGRCATLNIAYDSTVVRKALESAKWQRQHTREVH